MNAPARLAAACAALAVATIGFAGQASASPDPGGATTARAVGAPVTPAVALTVNCSTTGAKGGATVSNWNNGPDDKLTVQMGVYDTAADGHNAAIRFMTKGYNGVWHYYAWHHDTAGSGTAYYVNTTVQDTKNGIWGVGVQVAAMNGSSTIVHSCQDTWSVD
ncbi:hypothetical protein [Streptomyces sp. NPDC020917]|uniref:hypothetical protein n=1 Tax=Streptomyces sp. NPDC020917 TaxID=3365102 RepID=UPI003793677A